jgi:uncharacterized repeat protein (TIGR01451 family)
MRARNTGIAVRRTVLAGALACVLPAAAGAQTIWTGTTGDWFEAGNWSSGIPDATADARIDNAGICAIGAAGAAAHSVELGFDTPDSGTLSIGTGASLDVAADLSVGYGGNGVLDLKAGGVVSAFSSEIGYTIVSDTGVHGDATVDGPGTAWNNAFELYVGYGTGTLTVTNGGSVHDVYGYLGYFPEFPGRSSGTATIDGAGSVWTNDASLHIGDSGTGVVVVSNGGALVNGEGDLGFNFASDGTATVTGAGSTWTTNGFLYVGNNGDGTLDVGDGGSVGSLGSFGYVSWASASTSTATIDGAGSIWTNASGLYVGFGGTGTLAITNGGTMQNGAFANVGFSPGASGTVRVSGAGSAFVAGGALSIGGNVSGPGGTGALDVDDGGTVGASAVNIWNTGTIHLDGAASIDAATVTIDAPLGVGAGGASIDGDLALTSAATTTMNVAAGSGGLAVSGAASLGGTLSLDLDGAIVPGQYTLIEAGGGLGGSAFASVAVTPPADMSANVTYDDTHAYLVLASTVAVDVGVAIVADRDYARAGETIDYTITLTNASTHAATGASITSTLSPLLDAGAATWTCLGPPESGCAASGTGNLEDSGLGLPASGTVTYRLSAPVLAGASDGVVETDVQSTLSNDPDPANDTASAVTTIVLFRDGFEPRSEGDVQR